MLGNAPSVRTCRVVFPSGQWANWFRLGDVDLCPACGSGNLDCLLPPDSNGEIRLSSSAAGEVDLSCPVCGLSLEWGRVVDESQLVPRQHDQMNWIGSRLTFVGLLGRTPPVIEQLRTIGRFPEFAGHPDAVFGPLIAAVTSGELTRVLELLSSVAARNEKDFDDWTALHWAASLGRSDMVRPMTVAGMDVNAANQRGETPLMLAAAYADEITVAALLAEGADPNAMTSEGYSLLNAVAECEPSVVPAGRSALHVAAARGADRVVDRLLMSGASVDLIDKGGTTPLMLAASGETVRLLVSAGADLKAQDARSLQPIHHAAMRGVIGAMNELAARGADLHTATSVKTGHTVLTCAIQRRDRKDSLAAIRWLVSHGVSVNQAAADKMLPLESAVRQNDVEIVRYLIDRGADIDGQGYRGTFAILSALDSCGGDRTEITRALLQAGANVNVSDYAHETPLIKACGNRVGTERIRMLIHAGADVNASGRYGKTALHHASEGSRADAVALLLAHGADRAKRDSKGRLPIDVAKTPEIVALLSDV